MKRIYPLIAIACLVGCSGKSPEAANAEAAKSDPFVQKLNSLPESERAAYARAHAAEAMASGGAPPAATTSGN